MPRGRGKRSGPLVRRKGDRLTPAQQEAVVRVYFTNGNYSQTARELKLSLKAVKNAIAAAQNDPALMAARGQALDQMAGKAAGITDRVMDSITDEELVTTRHEVRDNNDNLLRVVTEGPSLRDKALFLGILMDKQKVLQSARNEATMNGAVTGVDASLMLPETLEGKRKMIMQKVKRMRIMDVEFSEGETGKTIDMALNQLGIDDGDVQEADVVEVSSVAPFD